MDPFDAQSKPPRRGRRDNGLGAERYIPLLDVDPRVGEHLLDVLRLAGVPAYLEPSIDLDPSTRATSLPSPPTDRLWVDRDRRETARDIVTAETAAAQPDPDRGSRPGRGAAGRAGQPENGPSHGLTDPDEERAWRDIVARYDRDLPAGVEPGWLPPWPVAEDLDRSAGDPTDRHPGPAEGDLRPAPGRRRRQPRRAEEPPSHPADEAEPPDIEPPDIEPPHIEPADIEEHYIPPTPPPIPRLSKQAVLALVLIAAGALLLLAPQVLGLSAQAGIALGVVALVSAGTLLVLRLREDRYDGPDDGAVL
jgi:hypothetical protein